MTTPHKSLGQNFFCNKSLAERIVTITTQNNPQTVLEIGSGTGSFSQLLSTRCKNYIALEKDRTLSQNLSNSLLNKATIINIDFLDANLSDIIEKYSINLESCVIFGSLPYNISKLIIAKLVTYSKFSQMFFIIQKEVAQSYCQTLPKNTYLSAVTQILYKPKILFSIGPESFAPRPKVQSAFTQFIHTSNDINTDRYAKYIAIVKTLFLRPRKTILNNLKNSRYSELINIVPPDILSKRAEQLSQADYVYFANLI